jgi:hypothetical protein
VRVLEFEFATFDRNLRQIENRAAAGIEAAFEHSIVPPQFQPADPREP